MTSAGRPLTFTSVEPDRVAHRRNDPDWLAARWNDPTTRVLTVAGGEVEVDARGAVRWAPPTGAGSGVQYLLGLDDSGCAVFASHVDSLDRSGSSVRGLRELAATESAPDLQWVAHAVALAQWHETHGHCPRCGAATEVAAAGAERRCPADGSSHFPRVDPAVIVLVTDDDDRALLGRQASWPDGRYSTLAGFVEPGESAEQAVRREVAEESGVEVVDVRLLATQPWPFPSSLMIGAEARAPGRPLPRPDGEELTDARWFSRAELRAAVEAGTVVVPGPISISRWLVDRWYGDDLPDDGLGWR